jgi:hypothetical protein
VSRLDAELNAAINRRAHTQNKLEDAKRALHQHVLGDAATPLSIVPTTP